MKKIILILLGIVFFNGYIQDIFTSERTNESYLILFVGVGIILVYLLSKFLSNKLLIRIQITLILLNVLLIIGIYIYGYISSSNSFGLGIMIWLLLAMVFSQLIILLFYLVIMNLQTNKNQEKYDNLIIFGYAFLFFLFHQVQIPRNYEIPFTTFVLSYGVTFILFGILALILIKFMGKDTSIPLIIAILLLFAIQLGGIDTKIFFLIPIQIIVIILLFLNFDIKNILVMKKKE